jgi:quercetin dioxygenase-like cupin family protein
MKALVVAAVLLAATPALAQPAAPVRTILQKGDLAAAPQEADLGTVDLAPGAAGPRHIHHGVETGYVAIGEVVLSIQGRPDQTLKVGDTFWAPREVPHAVKNLGAVPARVISTWIIDKGSAFSEPAP